MKKITICLFALVVIGCSSKNDRWVNIHEDNKYTYYADKETFDSKNHLGWIKQVPGKDGQKFNPENRKEIQYTLSKQIANCDVRIIKIDYMEFQYKDGSSEQIKLPFIRPRLEIIPGTSEEKVYNWLCTSKTN